MDRLFVYGTLAPGKANHHVMAPIGGEWEAATLRGHLMQEGWGAEMGSPGIVPSPDGEAVAGYVVASPKLGGHWSMLDAFEGDGYQRMLVEVTTESGKRVSAFVYALNRKAT